VAIRQPRAPAAAPATSAQIVSRVPSAAPVDLTADTFVTGSAASYAGGATTSSGTSTRAVEGPIVDPRGPTTGQAGSRARPVGLDEADWSCPWPDQADSAEVNEKQVLLRVAVRPDGQVTEVKVVSDPGLGFGQAARACALRTRFQPALDHSGQAIAAWSGPIRVRFIR
jgi:protein TonB